MGVRLYMEGARVGSPLAAVEACDPQCSLTNLNAGVREETDFSGQVGASIVR